MLLSCETGVSKEAFLRNGRPLLTVSSEGWISDALKSGFC